MVSKEWYHEWTPRVQLRDLQELLDVKLELLAANGTKILFNGWIKLELELAIEGSDVRKIKVPMSVTPNDLSEPIIGYNVIKEVANHPTSYKKGDNAINPTFNGETSKRQANPVTFSQMWHDG